MSAKKYLKSLQIEENKLMSDNFNPKTFDNYGEIYEKMFAWPYRQQIELPTIKNLMGDLSGLNILDFGCGPGIIARWLNTLGTHKVVGYDISQGMINHARKQEAKVPVGIEYFSDINQIEAGSFDIVLAAYVMPYVANKSDLLAMSQSMFKLLKPGGKLITLPMHPEFIADPEYYRPIGIRLIEQEPRADGSKVKACFESPYNIVLPAHYWSRKTLENTLYQTGFQQVNWQPLNADIKNNPSLETLSFYVQSPYVAIIECIKGK